METPKATDRALYDHAARAFHDRKLSSPHSDEVCPAKQHPFKWGRWRWYIPRRAKGRVMERLACSPVVGKIDKLANGVHQTVLAGRKNPAKRRHLLVNAVVRQGYSRR